MERKTVLFLLVLYFLNVSFLSTVFGGYVCKKRNGKFSKIGSFCRTYYYCRNWRPKEIDCPEDQHFFPAKQNCVWSEEYPCPEKRISDECPTPDGKFPKPGTRCKIYYDCCNGKATEKNCPGDSLFDHVRQKCEWPELYTCNDKPVSKKCLRPKGKFLKPGTECKIYYDCDNGQPTEKKCPKDQLFDHKEERCDRAELLICGDDTTSKKCLRPNGKFLKTGTKCKIYYDCKNGQPTEKKCPKDQLFHNKKGRCEWPELVDCEDDGQQRSKNILCSSEEDSGSNERGRSTTSITATEEDSSEEKSSSSSEEIQSTQSSKTPWPFTRFTTFSSSLSVEITTSTFSSPSTYKDTVTTDSASTTISIASSNSPVEITTFSSYPPFTDEETSSSDSTSTTLSTAFTYSPVEITTSSPYRPFTNEDSSRTDSTFTTLSTTSDRLPIETSSDFSSTSEEKIKTDDLVSTSSSTSSNNLLLKLTTTSSPSTEEDNSIKIEDSSSTLSTLSTRDDLTDPTIINIFCPEPNGYFPHPTDKHKFIGCVDGDPRILTCPANLVYNHKKRACVYG